MAQIANDLPKYIRDMLNAVDFNRITEENYQNWQKIISENIGKHLKKRTKPATLKEVNAPISQSFCDLINEYDFNSLPVAKQIAVIPLAKTWANNNLPLKRKI